MLVIPIGLAAIDGIHETAINAKKISI